MTTFTPYKFPLPPAVEWKQLTPFEKQRRLFVTKKRRVCVVAGRGAGKSTVARRRCIWECLREHPGNPTPWILFLLPTFPQAKRVAWAAFINMINPVWLESLNITDGTFYFKTGAKLTVAGCERPQRLEGNQYAFIVIDERSDQRPELITRSLLPTTSEFRAPIWEIGVPKRFGVGGPSFRETFMRGLTENPIYESYQWTSKDVKSPEEIKQMGEQMSAEDAEEMLNAQWLEMGSTLWRFKPGNITEAAEYNPSRPVIVGCDFNVNPMSWVLGHEIDGDILVFDEVRLKNVDTGSTLNYLASNMGTHRAGWEFVGDASSRARKTNSTLTDYMIIEECNLFHPKRVMFERSNPSIEDSIRHANAGFENMFGKQRVFINPRCTYLISDLERMYRDEKTGEPKSPSPEIGHMADAFRYLVWHKLPVSPLYTGESAVGVYN